MPYLAFLDSRFAGNLCSAPAWSAFTAWVRSLHPAAYPELRRFADDDGCPPSRNDCRFSSLIL
jgi:hypothetical protein